ncbi:hypothetical protein [Aquisalimonas sp.]|uniref:hypothetical protein n=1 Tax=Aquisalimonas sp. TaxID=1872621 RepID=UPI0025BCA0E4|nr:hypothetical protein [Aquisalimonas sp.]
MSSQLSRATILFATLLVVSAAIAAYLAPEVASLGQRHDPFGEWPWVYVVIPMSFLFVITHPLVTLYPATLGVVFTIILFSLALIATRPLRRRRYRFFDAASLWFFGIGIPTFIIADNVLLIQDPYFNLLAAFGVAVVGAVIVYFAGRRWLRLRGNP